MKTSKSLFWKITVSRCRSVAQTCGSSIIAAIYSAESSQAMPIRVAYQGARERSPVISTKGSDHFADVQTGSSVRPSITGGCAVRYATAVVGGGQRRNHSSGDC